MTRILVVDDDPDFVEITRTILEAKGYEVQTASSGAQALPAMRESKPDLVLLDVMMSSVLDGVNLSHAMHADPALRQVPIIMISSIAESPSAGFFPTDEYVPIDAWISKPFQPDDLLKKVASLLAK